MIDLIFEILQGLIHLVCGLILFCYLLLIVGLLATPLAVIVVAVLTEILRLI